jgi:UDPglucose 6-dehydrogenase
MASIVIVGAGVVGTATGAGLSQHGHDVTFVDISPEAIARLSAQGYRAITPDMLDLTGMDAVFVSVTALTGDDGIDLSHLLDATHMIGEKLATTTSSPVIVYRCTMPPGVVRDQLTPLLECVSGKTAGFGFDVAYSPEYLRAVSAADDFLHPRLVTIATHAKDDRAHQLVHSIMNSFGAPVEWLSLEEAEFQKYVNNVYNAIKISAFNFFRVLAQKAGIDPEPAFQLCTLSAEGLYNPAYGTRNYGPYDGACLPKDLKALLSYARTLGVDAALLEATAAINRSYAGD